MSARVLLWLPRRIGAAIGEAWAAADARAASFWADMGAEDDDA